ncbi:unnamed protein product [Rotaria sordida]|uniref:Protein kinase domain-containing protein n=1 Tax=Rotaria sordida TaxID=392033 RepID=A0A815BJK7_9BILA|nr:unnamed protein product [Rotaria sordida]
MMNNYNLTYRIIDTLKRFESNDKDSQYCQTYLINDEKDKNKTKYILRLIDLENLTNLTEFIKDISCDISSKNIYLCDNGHVLLDHFSHCISMISTYDGKLRKQIHDYTDKLKDQVLYLAPEVIYQNTDGYNFKSDIYIYSLDIVACELANGNNTYINMSYGNLSERI